MAASLTAAKAAGTELDTPREASKSGELGLFPLLSVVGAAGILLVSAGNLGGRIGTWWAELAFWAGLLVLYLPISLRLFLEHPKRSERILLVAALALGLFVCKVVHDPLRVGGYDEFLHWRTAEDILGTGRLFVPNTLLDVSPYYPGMELATTAISNSAGVSIFDAGIIILMAARFVFLLSLFFFFEMASKSARVAGLACVIYMTNPKFLYFNAQFSYESFALPLAALVLYLIARRGYSRRAFWLGLTVLILTTIPAIVATHHVTSAMLAAILVVWGVVALVVGRRDPAHPKPGRIAVFTILTIAAWTLTVATATIGYLGPALVNTLGELLKLIRGDLQPRELFVSRIGDIVAPWERIVGSASAAIILIILPLGLWIVWRNYRNRAVVIAMGLAASVYPATLLARLTRVGSEVAARTPEFLFVPIGLVIALGIAWFTDQGRRGRLTASAFVLLVAVLAVGGVVVGMPPWSRLPGPYLVSADSRSVESEGIAAATWAHDILGPNNRIVADRVNRMLLATYGSEVLVVPYGTGISVRRLYLVPNVGDAQRVMIRDGDIHYLVADWRLTTGSPLVGYYFDKGEDPLLARQGGINETFLRKFDQVPEISRIFDSGNIRIYDVSRVGAEP